MPHTSLSVRSIVGLLLGSLIEPVLRSTLGDAIRWLASVGLLADKRTEPDLRSGVGVVSEFCMAGSTRVGMREGRAGRSLGPAVKDADLRRPPGYIFPEIKYPITKLYINLLNFYWYSLPLNSFF